MFTKLIRHAVWLISCLCLLAFKKNLQSVNCAFETSDNHMEAWLSMCTVKIQKEKWDIAVWEETITYKPKRGRHSSTECHPNLKAKQQKTNWLLRIPSENPTFPRDRTDKNPHTITCKDNDSMGYPSIWRVILQRTRHYSHPFTQYDFLSGARALQFFSGCFAYNSTCDGACLSEIVFEL